MLIATNMDYGLQKLNNIDIIVGLMAGIKEPESANPWA